MLDNILRLPAISPICAVLTPRGRGAVATVGYAGPLLLLSHCFRSANGASLDEQPIGRVVFGAWGSAPAEEVVLVRTADDEFEIHCHGGDAATQRILTQLQSSGCTVQPWRDWLDRREGAWATECAEALSRAPTLRTAAILLEQQSGRLSEAVRQLQQDTEPAESAMARIDKLLRWSRFGLHLTEPWTVVLAGRPNVGKSSLINALLGYTRSIVYDQPGTTRDVVTAETAFDGWPLRLADTAGIRVTAPELEAAGIRRTHAQLAAADLQVLVLDSSQPPTSADRELLDALPDALVVAHKCDLPVCWGEELPPAAAAVSSLTGAGLNDLIGRVVDRLVPAAPPSGTPIPFSHRQVECLRAARDVLLAGDWRQAVQLLAELLRDSP